MEAQPLLYHRPINLSSQAKLFDWIDRSRAQNLKQVRHLALHLTDIDLSPLLASRADRRQDEPHNEDQQDRMSQQNTPPPSQPPTPSAWTLYESELARLDTSLRSLPGLTELTLVPPRAMHSQLLRGMYLSLLALIPRLLPGLKVLIVHDDAAILDVVEPLRGVRRVVFRDGRAGVGGAGAGGAGGSGVKKERSFDSSGGLKSSRGRGTRVKVNGE